MRRAVPLLLLLAAPAAAQGPAPARPTPQAAVRKAGEFLRAKLAPAANFTPQYSVGGASLAGLAMLEARVPADDPSVRNVTAYVRAECLGQTATYQVALAILYLDRLGDPADVPTIQYLGVRLYAAMNALGGWSYNLPPAADAAALAAVLRSPHAPGTLHPAAANFLRAARLSIAAAGRSGVADDNSNTQFALVALWVASRHSLPVADAFYVIEQRFARTQSRADGGWSYSAGDPKSTASMTCAGLLALAAGASKREAAVTGKTDLPPPPAAAPPAQPAGAPPKPNDSFGNPRGVKKPGEEPPPEPENPERVAPGLRTAAVQAGLQALGRVLAATPNTTGGPGPQKLGEFVGHGDWYYMLWSVERVGVVMGLETIGDVDWYEWGCSYLLPAQSPEGAWLSGSFGDTVSTSFAVLFLCKTNLVRDLRMKDRVKDPGKAELRAGGGGPGLFAPKRDEPPNPYLSSPSGPAAPPPVGLEVALPQVKDTGEAAKLAEALLAAKEKDEAFADRLTELRDSKGVMRTLALSRALATLEGARRKQTRDALAQRMARMTPATLAGYLRDQEPELRRAAALAAGMRGEASLSTDLVERITDPNEGVVRAARAALAKLSGEDHGPAVVEPAAQAAAAEAWRRWAAGRKPGG